MGPIRSPSGESARHEDAQKRLISATAAAQKRRAEVLPTKARRLFEDGARASRRARAVPCSGRRGNRASEVEVGLLGLPRQNIEPSSLQEKLHVDLTGQGSRGKRHRGKAESPETSRFSGWLCAVVRTAVSSLLLLFWEYGTWSVCGAVVKIEVEVAIAVFEVVSE